jgi:hypothetical protein
MRYLSLTAVLILSAGLASNAAASEIYKWTDADGNVHYTDKPMDPSYEHLTIASRATDNASVQAQTQARLERQATAAEEAANAPAGPTRDELRAEAKERAEKCSLYRERMTRFVQSRHLYREGENGERVYLDESEKTAAEQKVQDQIKEYCNS